MRRKGKCPEDMLIRVIRVAEILAKGEDGQCLQPVRSQHTKMLNAKLMSGSPMCAPKTQN